MKKFICSISIIFSVLTLFSCESEFIRDPVDPRLPKYTEDGHNVAGAFINQDTWKSEVTYTFSEGGIMAVDAPFICVCKDNDSTNIQLSGYSESYPIIIAFNLKGLNLKSFKDLQLLKNKKIKLDGNQNFGLYHWQSADYKNPVSAKGEIGQLYFRNVSLQDSSSVAVISGTFGFSFNDSIVGKTKVSYGRFDYKVRENEDFIIK